MEQSQYCQFPSRSREGVDVVMKTAGDRDHIECFTDQVKPTRAFVRDLNEAIKEVNLVGEHEEETRQKIIELEVVCKRLREVKCFADQVKLTRALVRDLKGVVKEVNLLGEHEEELR
jgi:5-bromo-4-chloroindolyl phosphate hydrolysis protein